MYMSKLNFSHFLGLWKTHANIKRYLIIIKVTSKRLQKRTFLVKFFIDNGGLKNIFIWKISTSTITTLTAYKCVPFPYPGLIILTNTITKIVVFQAAQDLEKDAQQLFLAFYFEDLSKPESSSPPPTLVDAVIYSLRANGILVFIPKFGIKGAVCLCNKERKVAIVRNEVEWIDGKLTGEEFCLTVEASGVKQRYRIFDHITVSGISLCTEFLHVWKVMCTKNKMFFGNY